MHDKDIYCYTFCDGCNQVLVCGVRFHVITMWSHELSLGPVSPIHPPMYKEGDDVLVASPWGKVRVKAH